MAQCRVRVQGRYPFGNGEEMTLKISATSLDTAGCSTSSLPTHIDKLVDTSQRPWTWRPESVTPPPAMLAQFERAERIRQMFFSTGSKSPEVGFMLRLSNLDAAASRFYVNIDGQQSEIKSGTAETMVPMTWPGPDKRGGRVVDFEDRTAPAEAAHSFAGPWAWFRLIDAGTTGAGSAQPETLSTPCSIFRRSSIRSRPRSSRRTPPQSVWLDRLAAVHVRTVTTRTAPAPDDRDQLGWAGPWK